MTLSLGHNVLHHDLVVIECESVWCRPMAGAGCGWASGPPRNISTAKEVIQSNSSGLSHEPVQGLVSRKRKKFSADVQSHVKKVTCREALLPVALAVAACNGGVIRRGDRRSDIRFRQADSVESGC